MSDWPRTESDKVDDAFYANPPSDVPAEYLEAWRRREICGCGDWLESETERRDGICEICKDSELRTPRPGGGQP